MTIQKLSELPDNLFVTGTDTEVGKTYCTSLLLKYFQEELNETVFPFKPISAGVEDDLIVSGKMVNADAFELWQACNKTFSIEQINPVVFQQPIAPHIAAEYENQPLNVQLLDGEYGKTPEAQRCLIEGAGGWLLPLNDQELLSQWVAKHELPVVLVVGIKLGCLNHALLTAQAIDQSGCNLVGWVANFIEGETLTGRKNFEYIDSQLNKHYDAPCLFEVQQGQTSII